MQTIVSRLMAVALLSLGNQVMAQTTADAPDCIYENDQTYRISTPTEVHTGPSRTRRVIYDLPAEVRSVRCVGPCRNEWCRIRWKGVVGWVERHHLVADQNGNTTKP